MLRKKLHSGREALYQLAESDPAGVIANPVWRRLKGGDSGFMAKTPAAFRLALLRHHFKQNRDNPWEPLARAHGGEPEWPTWDGGVFDLLHGYELQVRARGERPPLRTRHALARGWKFSLLARDADLELMHDREEDGGPYGLDWALELLFERPEADPRASFEAGDTSVCLDSGSDCGYGGLELLRPDDQEPLEPDPSLDDWMEFSSQEADTTLIAELRRRRQVFSRRAEEDEHPRPLFARTPEIDESWANEGRIPCRWNTVFYVPLDSDAAGGTNWAYSRHTLSHQAELTGLGSDEVCENPWRFRTIAEMESTILKTLGAAATHQFLRPLYDHILFAADARKSSDASREAVAQYPPAGWLLTRRLRAREAFTFLAECFSERMVTLRLRRYAAHSIAEGIAQLHADERVTNAVRRAMEVSLSRNLPEEWDGTFELPEYGEYRRDPLARVRTEPDLQRAMACLYLAEAVAGPGASD